MYCKFCGKENSDEQKFCKYCGNRLYEPKICLSCGKENRPEQKFCRFCGTSLLSEPVDNTEPLEEELTSPITDESGYDQVVLETEYTYPEIEYHVEEAAVEIPTVEEGFPESVNEPENESASEAENGGIDRKSKALIALIVVLLIALVALGLSLFSFFKTGSFNPIKLFSNESTEDMTESKTDDADKEDSSSDSAKEEETPISVESMNKPKEADKDEESEADADVDVFTEFMDGKATATVADDFLPAWGDRVDLIKSGQTMSLNDIKEVIKTKDFLADDGVGISYTVMEIYGNKVYAFNIYDAKEEGGNTNLIIMAEKDNKLEIKFANDGHMRKWNEINEDGVVSEDGGVWGIWRSAQYAPDKSLTYRTVYDCNTVFYVEQYNPDDCVICFYKDNKPVEALNTTMWEAAKGNEKAVDICYYMERIKDDVYYYYLEGHDNRLTQDTVDYIDSVAASQGFGFDGKAAADEAREAYEKELGVYDACQNKKSPQWKELK